ncbi:hypothetical protein [Actinokineospora bangkokensis]|uniref:ESX secretion-associated protein EspG n=1 Tax=Actinokineospora bangkokensis TaxID=1193682 RepID=A0A1Q9LFZ9_9PSEU|nr:hypothetical protein [Actinokineospora bangkokensis]OLR90879.1 hypothetical protein BJP25_30440 [Actinokineospora bangkokensis]
MPATQQAPAAHRLVLTAAEYAFLVAKTGLELPPDWAPAPDIATGAEAGSLVAKGALRGSGDMVSVHPSVEMNLRVLAAPVIMFDTTATIGARGSRSLHAFNGVLGASLFLLPDAGVELSLFAAVELGRELVRAVPEWSTAGSIGSLLDDPEEAEPLAGTLPLAALHELGVAELLRDADPGATDHVLRALALPADEEAFALEVARRTDGALRVLGTALIGGAARTVQLTWLHSDAGWVGISPVGGERRLVRLDPVDRDDLGVWLAPYISEAVEQGEQGR